MNYYNPYFYSMPVNLPATKNGIFSSLMGGKITISKFLNGTQRVLNFANQAIPLVKQVRPMIGNAKTMFKVMNEFKRVEKISINDNKQTINPKENIKSKEENKILNQDNYNGPIFFM